MKLTVIVPTYNRFEKLRLTLNALNEQTYKDFSLIVMDDGSGDNTFEKCSSISNQFSYPVNVHSQPNGGASKAINHAVSLVTEGLIVLFDDDIIPSASCLEKHVAHHLRHPGCLLSGPAYTDENADLNDVERYKVVMEKSWRQLTAHVKGAFKVEFSNFMITTANMSFTRETFERIGGFDEALRDGYDYEFGLRALAKNVDSFFDPEIEAIHNDRISLRYYAKRQRCYMESKKTIFALNPHYKTLLKKDPELKTSFAKKLIYKVLAKDGMVRFIEHSQLFRLLPRSIRYRFYGSTIAALSLS